MKFKTTLFLFITVCLLGLSVWVLNILSSSSGHDLVENDRIFHSSLSSTDLLLVNSTNLQIQCEKTGSEWFFVRPLTARANTEKVKHLINSLETTEYVETITLSQRVNRELELDDFGFNSFSPKLVIGSGTNRCSLLLGNKSPMGDLAYMKFAHEDDVMVVRSTVLDVLPKNIELLRDRIIMPGTTVRTSKLMIQKGGSFIELSRDDKNDWSIEQPLQFSADNAIVDGMLDLLYQSGIEAFVWDKLNKWNDSEATAGASGDDISARNNRYCLTPDLATVTVKIWLAGNKSGTELMLGKFTDESKKHVYAKLRGNDSIFTCSAELTDIFNIVSISELRNRNLIHLPYDKINELSFCYNDEKLTLRKDKASGWMMLEPVKWKADDKVADAMVKMLLSFKIEEFVATTATNAIAVKPMAIAEICLSTVPDNVLTNGVSALGDAEGETKVTQCILMLQGKDRKIENVIARYEDDKDNLLKLNVITKDMFYKNLTEPLFFRDRRMLSLDKKSVVRIEVNINGKSKVVTKSKDDTWHADDPKISTVNKDAVEMLLLIAANMRALRIESDNIKKPEAYGLDQITTSVTFGLSGEDGIRKIVHLGFKAGTDGIYARIQGEDTVFVISTELLSYLTMDVY